VKRSGDKWRLRDHVAFFSYRWLALAVAIVATALRLQGAPAEDLTRNAGLLLLIGVITVVATALAQSYVRVLRQRPGMLALDLVACSVILWLSGSTPLPFLPYALGALVLPGLAFGWRGAAFGAAAFAALDMVGLTVFNHTVGEALSPLALGARVLTPFAFAFIWAAAGRLLPREASPAGQRSAAGIAEAPPTAAPGQSPSGRQSAAIRVANIARADTPPAGLPANFAATTPLLLARAAAEAHPERPRRILYDLPASPDVSLAAALEQLATSASRRSGVEVRSTCVGEARPLNASQQMVLLRCAQEALLNVEQHARAHTALVTLSFEPRAVTLAVQDDGVGLLDGTYERPGLHALRAVRYRLAELDGQLAVFDNEGSGLTLRATLPLD
jgi:hypothetical protein